LRGQVLRIGGLKEKLLAAHRGGIKTVVIPKDNRRDLKDIPKQVLKELEVHCVQWIDEVLTLALTRQPQPLVPVAEKAAPNKDVASSGEIQAH